MESSLPASAEKLNHSHFPQSSVSGSMSSSRITLPPWWGNQGQTRVMTTTCKHCDFCPSFPALKTRPKTNKNHSAQSSIRILLEINKNSSPHWGRFLLSLPRKKESVGQRFRPKHVYSVVLISVTSKKALYLNSHNITHHLTLSTRAPFLKRSAYFLSWNKIKTPYNPHYPHHQNRTEPLENLAFTVCTLHALFKNPVHRNTQTRKDTIQRSGDCPRGWSVFLLHEPGLLGGM